MTNKITINIKNCPKCKKPIWSDPKYVLQGIYFKFHCLKCNHHFTQM